MICAVARLRLGSSLAGRKAEELRAEAARAGRERGCNCTAVAVRTSGNGQGPYLCVCPEKKPIACYPVSRVDLQRLRKEDSHAASSMMKTASPSLDVAKDRDNRGHSAPLPLDREMVGEQALTVGSISKWHQGLVSRGLERRCRAPHGTGALKKQRPST
ncbi:hypothetical protein HPB50_014797 [Hyalomma asiaticum]|uniref:Uncharacterized protein n=1 Tax=Hyalomma asiaticum TaxID=266040 RepID=A0ACB7SHM0_HYAAI|nr:hypothetical protein HPB50_014797 [Hyalomma asiaticum]